MPITRADLIAALGRSKGALAAFEALPASHQARWLAHIGEAKRADTVARRIESCIEELAGAPKATSGYSGTPLLKKLGIADGHRVAILDGPDPLPGELSGVEAPSRLAGRPFDVIVVFVTSRAALQRRFAQAVRHLASAGGLWVAWPKRASGVATDVTENTVREVALAAGLVDNKVCAIDEVWSGLRCVVRLADRAAREAARKR